MGLLLDKAGRMARHALDSNALVYRSRRANLARKGGKVELPGYEAARERVLAMRPPLDIPLPERHDMWPESPEFDITVIVPCYNVEKFVEEAIRSVLCQECEATFEVVAVDDGSTDGTRAVLESIGRGDSRMRVISQENNDLSGARNTGLRAAAGASIVFIDSDDVLAPGALSALYGKLRAAGADYVTGSYEYIDEQGHPIPVGKRRPTGVPWARIFDREVWRDLEFPEGVWFEDTVHAYMIAPRFKEATIDNVVYSYRKQTASITVTSRSSKRSVDTYFVTEAMVEWRRALGPELDQAMFDQTLYQLGPLLLNRTVALDEDESRCLFVLAAGLLKSLGGGSTSQSSEIWRDLEKALMDGDYPLWRLSAGAL